MKKRRLKNKQEVLDALKNNAAFQDKMQFVKERFYPALLDATTSIEDAQQLLAGFNTQIMQSFLEWMKTVKTSELKLAEKLDATAEKHEAYVKMLELFDEMSVFDAKDYIEGMRSEIALFIKDEMESRSLSTLKAKWIDEHGNSKCKTVNDGGNKQTDRERGKYKRE